MEKKEKEFKEYWEKILSRIEASGMTRREFCKQMGISEYSFSGMRKHCPSVQFLLDANKILDYDFFYIFDSSLPKPKNTDVLKDYEKELITEIRKVEKKNRKNLANLMTLILKTKHEPESVLFGFLSDLTGDNVVFGNKEIAKNNRKRTDTSSTIQPDLFTEFVCDSTENASEDVVNNVTSYSEQATAPNGNIPIN